MPSKDDEYEVADSTDWLETPFAVLAPVEAALRCQVCKDFYTTPMITSCSHTFCSLCIRRCLSNDGKCPTCRSPEQELKLRSNWNMEEAVDAFQKARSVLLGHAKVLSNTKSSASSKRKASEAEMEGVSIHESPKRIRTSDRLATRQSRPRTSSAPAGDKYGDDAEDDDYIPDGSVPHDQIIVSCPICGTKMKMDKINSHIDTCTENSSYVASKLNTTSNTSVQNPSNPNRKFERLPTLSYSLLKDSALKKKLAELGISMSGNRQLLERRHTEWVTLWNANCDSKNPRKKSELLHDLEIWEKTQGGRASLTTNGFSLGNQILSKDFDGAGWAAKHDQSFQQLIEQAKAKVKAKSAAEESNYRNVGPALIHSAGDASHSNDEDSIVANIGPSQSIGQDKIPPDRPQGFVSSSDPYPSI